MSHENPRKTQINHVYGLILIWDSKLYQRIMISELERATKKENQEKERHR
jgi:hypothetical protein